MSIRGTVVVILLAVVVVVGLFIAGAEVIGRGVQLHEDLRKIGGADALRGGPRQMP